MTFFHFTWYEFEKLPSLSYGVQSRLLWGPVTPPMGSSHGLRLIKHGLRLTKHGLGLTKHGLGLIKHGLRLTKHGLRLAKHDWTP